MIKLSEKSMLEAEIKPKAKPLVPVSQIVDAKVKYNKMRRTCTSLVCDNSFILRHKASLLLHKQLLEHLHEIPYLIFVSLTHPSLLFLRSATPVDT